MDDDEKKSVRVSKHKHDMQIVFCGEEFHREQFPDCPLCREDWRECDTIDGTRGYMLACRSANNYHLFGNSSGAPPIGVLAHQPEDTEPLTEAKFSSFLDSIRNKSIFDWRKK